MVGLTVVLGSVMSMLDTTSVNVALHDLAGDFGVSVTEVHWVASAYLLALAVAIPLSGWASARFGGRRVWMTSVSIFLTGSILAGISWSLGSLIAFRILQGFGGGMILPVGMAMLVRTAGPGRVGRALGILGIAQLLGPVLGPVLGGLLVQDGGWRWIFYVNVPIGALALVLAARHLPTHPPDPGDRLDLKGFALLAPGLAGLVYGLASISNGGAAGVRAFAPMLAGIALVAAFVIHALRVSNPLIDVRLFARRAYAGTAGTALCLGMNLFGAMFLLPLYYQSVRGQGALDAGLLIAPQGIGAAMMMPFAGRATDRFGPGRVVPLGLCAHVAWHAAIRACGRVHAVSPARRSAGAPRSRHRRVNDARDGRRLRGGRRRRHDAGSERHQHDAADGRLARRGSGSGRARPRDPWRSRGRLWPTVLVDPRCGCPRLRPGGVPPPASDRGHHTTAGPYRPNAQPYWQRRQPHLACIR